MREENLTLAEKMKQISIESEYGLFEREKTWAIKKVEEEAKKGRRIACLVKLDKEIFSQLEKFFKEEGFQTNSVFVKETFEYGLLLRW